MAPRIIDATLVPAAQFPTVGKVGRIGSPSICTGTLIAPRFVITAAHCVVNDGTGKIAFKQNEGAFTLGDTVFNTAHIYLHPDYHGLRSVSIEGVVDLAIYELDRDVPGVTPTPLNSQTPAVGQLLTLAGYGSLGTGTSGATRTFPPDGMIGTGTTPIDFVTDTYVKWHFDKAKPPNKESDTAPGDSGGPQFLNVGGVLAIASVTSGGFSPTSKFGDLAFNTRIDIALPWIQAIVGGAPAANNNPPVIQSVSAEPLSPLPDQIVTFSTFASDADFDALNFNWFFGDGTEVQSGGATQTHSYAAPGNYLVQVVVTDGKGGSSADSMTLTVQQTDPPTQTLTFPKKSFKLDFKNQTGASLTLAMQESMLMYSSASAFKAVYPDGTPVSVFLGDVPVQTFKLIGTKSKIGNDSIAIDTRKGIVTFQTKANQIVAGVLAQAGTKNANTVEIVVVPAKMRIGSLTGVGNAEFLYKAKLGVSAIGKAE